MKKVKDLILGGGFAGLELATRMPGSTIISPDLGGLISSNKQGNFTFDFGGHVYTTQDQRVAKLMKDAGAKFFPKREAYYVDMHLHDYPTFAHYPVQEWPSQIGLSIDPKPDIETTNLGLFLIKAFGYDFYDKFLGPFNRRVWSTDPGEMDFDWINGRIELPSEKSDKLWGMNSSFYYAPGYKVVEVMKTRTDHVSYIKGFGSWDPHKNHVVNYMFETKYGPQMGEIEYENLFVTTPQLANKFGASGMLANRILCIGVGLNRDLPLSFNWIYADLSSIVHRVTLLSRYYRGMAPDGCDSLLIEIPAATATIDLSVSKESVAKMLTDIGITITAADIETLWVAYGLGYPIQTLGLRKTVAALKAELMPRNIWLCGRWGSWGYWNLQHIFQDVDATMNAVNGEDVPPYLTSSFYYRGPK